MVAAGLALALEGAAYALFPNAMKRLIAVALATEEGSLRLSGPCLRSLRGLYCVACKRVAFCPFVTRILTKTLP